jgi:6-phosphogluconolactonase (cycloisomerase 2 family)
MYVANKGSNNISAFSVDQNTGDLTQIASPFDTGANTAPSSVAVGPGGQFLYVANSGTVSGTGTIRWIPIDPVTGELSVASPIVSIPTGGNPQFIRIDPAGRLLYATDSTLSLVSVFSIDSVTGQLTATGTRAMRDGPAAVAFVSGAAAVAPTPTFAYVANAGDHTLSAFAIDPANGFLTSIAGSPFPVAPSTSPVSLSADPLGRFVFAGNSGTNDVSAFTLNGSTGNLTGIAGSPFSLLPSMNPQSVATDPSGRHVYVVNQGSNNVSAFSIASGTGILTGVGLPVSTGGGTSPRAVTVEPSGQFAYVVNVTTHEVKQFSINPTTGALGAGGVFPLAVAAAPGAIVADPSGRFLYVANTGNDTVSAYLINASTGSLTPIAGSPFSLAANAAP